MGVNHMATLDQTYSRTAQAVCSVELINVTCAKDSDKQLVVFVRYIHFSLA